MNKPVLVVMAAGMGSRYGGLKQLDPVGPHGELIIDYSLYDAKRAGFDTAVFVIKKENEEAFREIMGRGAAKHMNIRYVYQQLDDIPPGRSIPEGRVKPWGTGHAVLSARKAVNGPFAVINADDYYGPEGYKLIFDYLSNNPDGRYYEYCMVSYLIENTVTENGSVARGVCVPDEGGYLQSITERTQIEVRDGEIIFAEPNGDSGWIEEGTPVSMNLFGFSGSFMPELGAMFADSFDRLVADNPLKGEFYLPAAVSRLIAEDKARVKLLVTHDKWYGMTYHEDKEAVKKAMAAKTAAGLYPESGLWS